MRTYINFVNSYHCSAGANRLYKFVHFTKTADGTIPTGRPWAHDKLLDALDIQYSIIAGAQTKYIQLGD